MLSEINQTKKKKDKYCMILLMCGIKNYSKPVNIAGKKQTWTQRTSSPLPGGREVGRGEVGMGTKRHKPLCTE